MKNLLKILICVLLVIAMSLLLTACGEEETTTTTAPQPKEYSKDETAELLNTYFALLEGEEEDDGESFLDFLEFSMSNITYNGLEDLGIDKLYMKDGLTYTLTSTGDRIIEKTYGGYKTVISTKGELTTVDVTVETDTESMLDTPEIGGIVFNTSKMKAVNGSKNMFKIDGEIVKEMIGAIVTDELFVAELFDDTVLVIDMTAFEETGVITITADGDESLESFLLTLDASGYKDEKGVIVLKAEVDDTKLNCTLTLGEDNSRKLEVTVTMGEGSDKVVIKCLDEYKGDKYTIDSNASYKSCDAFRYEISVGDGSKSYIKLKLNAAEIGNTVKGYIEFFVGEEMSSGMGGVGFLSASSNKIDIKGSFDITLKDEEISTVSAKMSLEYFNVSGEATLEYNAANLQKVGENPLIIEIKNNGETQKISLKTSSYSDGQGFYDFEYRSGNNYALADVAIPAIKDFQFNDKEQLYLDRAEVHFKDLNKVNENVQRLERAVGAYVSRYEGSSLLEHNIITATKAGSFSYYAKIWDEDGVYYYSVTPVLDFEYYQFACASNQGGLSNISIKEKAPVLNVLDNVYNGILSSKTGYSQTVAKNYAVGFEYESAGAYVYFNFDTMSYLCSKTPMGQEHFTIPLHMVTVGADTIESIHNLETTYTDECYISYTCTVCANEYISSKMSHLHGAPVSLMAADGDRAACDLLECSRCHSYGLKYTDSDGDVLTVYLKDLDPMWDSNYGVAELDNKLKTYKLIFEGEGTAFDKTIVIPCTLGSTGKSIVGLGTVTTEDIPNGIALSIELQEGIRFLKEYSVPQCTASIKLPVGVWYIEEAALNSCLKLSEITINEGLKKLGSQNAQCIQSFTVNTAQIDTLYMPNISRTGTTTINCETVRSIIFHQQYAAKEVVLPLGAESILGLTGNPYVEKITVPYGITKLDAGTFSGCSGLREVVIPESLTRISNNLFKNCYNLTTIKVMKENGDIVGNDNEALIPDSVTEISSGAFSGCQRMTVLKLHDGVVRFDAECIPNTGIKEIVLPEGVSSFMCFNLGQTSLDKLVINGSINFYPTVLDGAVKEITFKKELLQGQYGTVKTDTVNILFTTARLSVEKVIPTEVKTVNFAGTEEQFNAIGFDVKGQETVINYNVNFQ